jgi:hypothetical protein
MGNLEKVILDYFKLINPLPYDEVKINMELRNVIYVDICVEDLLPYTSYPSSDDSVLKQIQKDMNDMFPCEITIRVIWDPK